MMIFPKRYLRNIYHDLDPEKNMFLQSDMELLAKKI